MSLPHEMCIRDRLEDEDIDFDDFDDDVIGDLEEDIDISEDLNIDTEGMDDPDDM